MLSIKIIISSVFQLQLIQNSIFEIIQMRIVRFSSPYTESSTLKNHKISLTKLSQVRALSSLKNNREKTPIKNQTKNVKQMDTHIKWISQPQKKQPTFEEVTVNKNFQQEKKDPLKVARRKIFQARNNQLKENLQIPTFTKMQETTEVPDQQTQYFSIIMNSPQQRLNESNTSRSKDSRSLFSTNQKKYQFQNIKLTDNHQKPFLNSINNKSTFMEITQSLIPQLELKIKNHDQQLSTIKKQLKNVGQFGSPDQNSKKHNKITSPIKKQDGFQSQRWHQKIFEAKEKLIQKRKEQNEQVEQKIKHLEEERVKRLERIQKQNQRISKNLKNNSVPGPFTREQQFGGYNFKGPIEFPSEDWETQMDMAVPKDHLIEEVFYDFNQRKYHKKDELKLSQMTKIKINQMSQINMSHNLAESSSLYTNNLRQFRSPLDFQGQNDTW